MPLFAVLSLYATAVAAGVSFVFQQVVNSNLRGEIGSPFWAGFVSYLGGTFAMAAMIMARREGIPSTAAFLGSSWLSWTGGLFGAVYIAISILLLPRLGAALVLALIVLGQMLGSVVFDHFGLLGLPQHSVTLTRLAGAGLLIAGAVLVRM